MNNPLKILIVDDDEEDYLIARDIIEEFPLGSYALEYVESYQKAEREILKNIHDVYLIDYRLGAKSGLDLVRFASENNILKPFIVLTGQDDLEIDEQAKLAGAVDYIVKGTLDPNRFERSIRYGVQQIQNIKKIRELNAQLEDRVKERTKALAKTNEALRESQRLYSTIASNFPDGMISVFDQNLNFVFLDGEDLVKINFSKDDLIGKNLKDAFSPEATQYFKQNLKNVFSGERTLFDYEMKEYGLHFSNIAVPLPEDDGTVKKVMVVSKNVTEQKRAEQEILNALEKEKQLGELKSRFVTTASHEFRTPLSTILSSVSLIDRYVQTENFPVDKLKKHVNRIRQSVNNLNQILTDFLSFGRLEEGKEEVSYSQFNLQDLVEEAVSSIRTILKPGQHIEYANRCDEDELVLDKQMLRNIIINLLSNASKYSGERKEITIQTSCTSNLLKISVKDQGIGIPEKDIKHIFGRFFRAKNAMNIEGTGLGLNIVKKYIELMGGEISFTSRESEGTEFFVNIPLNNGPNDQNSTD